MLSDSTHPNDTIADFSVTPTVSPGETLPVIATVTDDEIERIGEQVHQHFKDGALSFVKAGKLVFATLSRFSSDQHATLRFITVLHERGLLSKSDVRLGTASAKLSKLKTIGENAEFLQSIFVRERIPDGYSNLYELCKFMERQPGTPQQRIEATVLKIAAVDGPISRETIEEWRKAERKASRAAASADVASAAASYSNRDYDLVLATPSRQDMALLSADARESDHAIRCLRTHERISERAVGLFAVKAKFIHIIDERLSFFGFRQIKHFLLPRIPSSWDISEEIVILAATRDRSLALDLDENGWLVPSGPIDFNAIAEAIAPSARARLHLFSSDQRDGWDSIIGDANWSRHE